MTRASQSDGIVFPALTGWRFPLALWVLLYHLNAMVFDLFHPPLFVMDMLQKGYLAVDIFFVISGVVISHHYGEQLRRFHWRDYFNFLWLRLARIYPMHLMTLLGLAGMVIVSHLLDMRISQPKDYTSPLFFANIVLVQAWSLHDRLDWNHPAWSVSAEWFAYLASPVFFTCLWRPWPRIVFILVALAALALPPLVFHFSHDRHGTFALYRVTGGFITGICLYRLLPLQWRIPKTTGFWNRPVSLYLTHISYAFYMVQFPILLAIRKFWPHQHMMDEILSVRICYLVAIISLITLCAMLSVYLVENPARRYLRKRNPFRR